MPKRNKSSNKSSRKPGRRGTARDALGHSGLVTRSQRPFAYPDRFLTSLKYASVGNITVGIGFSDKIWNVNSLFDPDRSGTGHQPRYFDQLAAVYGRYRVTKATFDIVLRQRAAHGIGVNLVPMNSSTGLSSSNDLELTRAGEAKITSPNQPPVRERKVVLPHAIAGVSRATYMADDRYAAQVTSDPAEVICLHQYVYSLDGSTTIDYEYALQIVYEAEFFDLIDPGPSVRVSAALPSTPDWTPSDSVSSTPPDPPPRVTAVWDDALRRWVAER